MTNTEPGETASRRPRWLYGALIASLALNLVIAGGAAGAFFKHRHGHKHHGPPGLAGFVRDLAPERRTELGEFIKTEREKVKPLREEIRAGWTESNQALGAEPFDKEKLKSAMAKIIDAETRLRTVVSDAVVETAAKLTPQERQAMKAWRERMHERGEKKWRRRWDGDKDKDGDKD